MEGKAEGTVGLQHLVRLCPEFANRTAVRFCSSSTKETRPLCECELTYNQLLHKSLAFAQSLAIASDNKANLCIVYLNPSAGAIVAILGVLFSGRTYIPVSPTASTNRKLLIVQQCLRSAAGGTLSMVMDDESWEQERKGELLRKCMTLGLKEITVIDQMGQRLEKLGLSVLETSDTINAEESSLSSAAKGKRKWFTTVPPPSLKRRKTEEKEKEKEKEKEIEQDIKEASGPIRVTVLDEANLSEERKWGEDTFLGKETKDIETGYTDIAYIIFTSGTTGEPTMVKVPHKAVVNNVKCIADRWQVQPTDTILLASSFVFDPSIIEIFCALSRGATLFVVSQDIKLSSDTLLRVMKQHSVSILQCTPSLFLRLVPSLSKQPTTFLPSSLRIVTLGGEPFPSSVVRDIASTHPHISFFNIYGTTECSVWASMVEVSKEFQSSDEVPIICNGSLLSDTEVSVKDDTENEIYEGIGHCWIGGEGRICLLGDETEGKRMRDTGDIVRITKEGCIYYVGRRDNQVKISGQRVNLLEIEGALLHLAVIKQCKVIYKKRERGHKLVAFFSIHPQQQEEEGDLSELQERLADELPQLLSNRLSSAFIPSRFRLVWPSFPVTDNGKLDTDTLLQTAKRRKPAATFFIVPKRKHQSKDLAFEQSLTDKERVRLVLQSEWDKVLADLNADEEIKWNSGIRFYRMSADSMLAQRFIERLLMRLDVKGEKEGIDALQRELHNALADKPVSDLVEILLRREEIITAASISSNESVSPSSSFAATPIQGDPVWSLRRMNQLFYHKTIREHPSPLVYPRQTAPTDTYRLDMKWRCFLNKCVDASPLVIAFHSSEEKGEKPRLVTYVGSHFGIFAAIDIETGQFIWKQHIDGRIESSATASLSGQEVIVGGYDHFLHVFDAKDGSPIWKFETGDEIKSSPATDPRTGWIWFGCHDQHLYCVDINHRTCLSKIPMQASVFSSPVIDPQRRRVYVGTNKGALVAVSTESVPATVEWLVDTNAPIFSSPMVDPVTGKIFFGSCDGYIRCLSPEGDSLWKVITGGWVWSSPCLYKNKLFVGSFDGYVYCLHAEDGKEIQKLAGGNTNRNEEGGDEEGNKVASSPAVLGIHHADGDEGDEVLIAYCFREGSLNLDKINLMEDGRHMMCDTLRFQKMVFSSPVFVGDVLLVAARDNYLYCLHVK